MRVDAAVTVMTGPAAPPRRNGELVFDAPWQGRAFGMAVGVVERLDLEWKAFQERLIAAIAAHPAAPYYDCWVAALEQLVLDYRAVTAEELDAACEAVRIDT
ncbi:MAG TPA: nitrile hydratase accessory protein [Candidatus Margulisiibacteriota bacterium]|nr:nitrile hydratase accessory protein [Candidatus Margulisiibacteriota bacterium]